MALENKRQVVLIAIAAIAGVGAAVLTSQYVTKSISEKTQELHDQYVAEQKQMAESMRQQSQQQAAALQEEINKVRQEQQVALQRANEAMQAQQKAMAAQQETAKSKRSNTFLTQKTPPGKRAVTVMINSLNAVGGLLNAGDYVDVIAHLDVPQEIGKDSVKKKTITAMLFQDLQVLAINTNLDNPGLYDEQQNAPSLKVTFAVDPQEAGLLSFADKNGKLELALRAKDENDKQTVKASTWKALADYVLQNQGAAFDVPEENQDIKEDSDQKPYIQIFRGGKEL